MKITKNERIIIVGLGETANLAYEYFTYDSKYEIIAFCADKEYVKEPSFKSLPIVFFEDIEKTYSPKEYKVFVAIASGKLNRDRTKMYEKLKAKGYKFVNYISSKAFVWHNVEIGDNCFILEDNTLQPFAKIGNNVVMWSGNHLGHQSIVKDNCFITSHCVISGFCEIGENSFLGVNSCIADNIKIEKDNFIAMGSVVNKNTKENSLYNGNPAKNMGINAGEYFEVGQ